MEAPKAPQLTAYDFLGYIVPGLVLIFLGDVSYQFHFSAFSLTYEKILSRYGSLSWASLVPLLLIAYFVGHIVSFLSAMAVERHAGWMHGSPGKLLLYGLHADYLDTSSSRGPFMSRVIRVFILLFMMPIALIEIVLGKWCRLSENYFRPVDQLIKTAFLRAMSRSLDNLGITASEIEGKDPWEYELERLAIHCAVERAPMHVQSLRNYVVLYGFLRSMCFILLLGFWICLFHIVAARQWNALPTVVVSGAVLIFPCYAAFLKFWFRYYFEAIMAIIAISTMSSREKPSQTKRERDT